MSYGGAIKLSGESEYRKALQQISQGLREVGAQMKVTAVAFDRGDTSTEALAARSRDLTAKLELQGRRLETLKAQYASMSAEAAKQSTAHEQLGQKLESERSKLAELEATVGKTSSEYAEQEKVVAQCAKEYDVSTRAQAANEKMLSDLRIQIKGAEADYGKTTKALEDNAKAAEKDSNAYEDLKKKISDQKTELEKLKSAQAAAILEHGKNSKEAKALGKEYDGLKKELDKSEKALEAVERALNGTGAAAEKSGDKVGKYEKVLGGLQKVGGAIAKGLGVAFAAAGAGALAIGKQAYASYSAFEQLQGGVRKMFGDDVMGVVIENANNAFATAGMNANTYLETVTNFSASLIAGLEGDTAQAAKIADMAVKDMSDNANTFGTDIASIQHAYQGFAKQNFTMLDNLKLGYGGTKGEMLRLLKDVGLVDKSLKSLDGVSFDTMIRGIHMVQEQLGIANTTAAEAKGTLEGSAKAVKASWDNLIAGMADSNADFDGLVNNFVDGVTIAAQNMLPRIQTIVGGLGNLFSGLTESLLDSDMLDSIMDTGVEIAKTLVKSLGEALPKVLRKLGAVAPDIMKTLSGLFTEVLPDVFKAITETLPELTKTFLEIAPDLIVMLGQLATDVLTQLSNDLPDFIDKVLMPGVMGIIDAICEFLGKNGGALTEAAIKIFLGIQIAIVKAIPSILKACGSIVKAIWDGAIAPIKDIFVNLWSWLWEQLQPIADWFGNVFEKAKEFVHGAFEKIGEWFSDRWDDIKGVFGSVAGWFKEKFQAAWRNIKEVFSGWGEFFSGLWNRIKNTFSTLGSSLASAIGGAVKRGLNSVISMIEDTLNSGIGLINGAIGLINKILPGRGIGTLNTLSLPRLARGGVLEKGQVGLLEGSGAEAVVPLENNTKWIKRVAGELESVMAVQKFAERNELNYRDMVDAFTDALTRVEVKLDDRKAGQFVKKTVRRAIYGA